MNTYYINNSGTRCRSFNKDGSPEKMTFLTKLGKEVTRVVLFWEAFGNFATCTICYKGKKISVFPDSLLDD